MNRSLKDWKVNSDPLEITPSLSNAHFLPSLGLSSDERNRIQEDPELGTETLGINLSMQVTC
jgi:hypothetical protein